MGKRKTGKKGPAGTNPNPENPASKAREPAPEFPPKIQTNQPPLLCIALCLLVLLAFFPVLSNDFINLDDPNYVAENYHVQSAMTWENIQWAFRSLVNANWRPLTWLSHMPNLKRVLQSGGFPL